MSTILFPKRASEDDQLCDRFTKRLCLDPDVQAPSSDPQQGNMFLHELHREQVARRQRSLPSSDSSAALTGAIPPADVEVWTALTHFTLADVVDCRHSPTGRCLQCSGREVLNVPLAVYTAYCQAFQGVPHFQSPTAVEASQHGVPLRSLVAGEVVFPAFAALAAELAPRPGERFLDLGSGVGRAVVAWALLFPQCHAAGIEIREQLHQVASAVFQRLDSGVRERIHLHRDDFFEWPWNDADVLLLNSTGLDEAAMGRAIHKLRHAASGMRVVTLSQPLPLPTFGFKLIAQRHYKMTWGNATAFIYRKC